MRPVQRVFHYLPLEHSESLQDQLESVRLFTDWRGTLLPKASSRSPVIYGMPSDTAKSLRASGGSRHRNPHSGPGLHGRGNCLFANPGLVLSDDQRSEGLKMMAYPASALMDRGAPVHFGGICSGRQVYDSPQSAGAKTNARRCLIARSGRDAWNQPARTTTPNTKERNNTTDQK
jgi:hypothetical protein